MSGVYVTNISNGGYIRVRGADFGKGAKKFDANVASATGGGAIEIHLDSLSGSLLAACLVKNSGGWHKWATQTWPVKKVKGVHDIYFVFKGQDGPLFNFNWWKFSAK